VPLVHEIYISLQGESTFAGLPCVFVRLTGCNLRCSYCDTAYAFSGGERMSIEQVLAKVGELAAPYTSRTLPHPHSPSARERDFKLPIIELTGGEPLLQAESLPLMTALCDRGHTVLVETSGAIDISKVDSRVRRIMDLKCPSSGEVESNRWENIGHLKATDEIKFVVGAVEDYEWTSAVIRERALDRICPLLVSWVHPLSGGQADASLNRPPDGLTPISRRDLVERIVVDALPVRFQAQLHKIIWPPEQRGV
jgi:7-carboxy-7-deazaguanine synthase